RPDSTRPASARATQAASSYHPLVMTVIVAAATEAATAEGEPEKWGRLIVGIVVFGVNRLIFGLRSANPDPVVVSAAPGPTLRRPGILLVISSRHDVEAESRVSLGRR